METILKGLKHQYQHSFVAVDSAINYVISQGTYNDDGRKYHWWIL